MSANSVSEHLANLVRPLQQQLLRFRLHPDLAAAIDIDCVTELINIPVDRVVPMPHLPPAVMGVYNWRGEILWIADFGKLLGLNAPQSARHSRSLQPTIVVSNLAAGTTMTIGLMVAEIEEIEWCETAQIQAPTPDLLPQSLSSWVTGSWRSTITGEEVTIFTSQSIFNSADLHANL
jgi:positive phototaxis protein PixI